MKNHTMKAGIAIIMIGLIFFAFPGLSPGAETQLRREQLSELAPSASGSAKTVSIAAGDVFVSGNTLKAASASTANFAAGNCVYDPVAASKYIKGVIVMNSAGVLSFVTTGSSEQDTRANAEAAVVTYPEDKLPIAEVVLYTTGTEVGNIANIEALGGGADTKSYIYKDVRPFLNLGGVVETDPVVKAISGIVKSNGSTISAASAGTDYVVPAVSALNSLAGLSTTLTGMLKASSGSISAASAGTDYVVTETDSVVKAISGIVKSNGSTISAASAGTDYVVPSVSALNSLTGISTTLTGMLKASSGSISAASAGTDYYNTLGHLQTAVTSDFHNLGGTDDDTPDTDAEVPNDISISNGLLYALSGGANLGIGTTAPLGLLQVGTSPNASLIVLASGNVGIGTTNPLEPLQVTGNIRLSGIIRQRSLGDLAEMMPLAGCVLTPNQINLSPRQISLAPNIAFERPEAGDVVVIDKDAGIRRSFRPFATNVVGIISTSPAQILRDELEDAAPVTLSGIVPCKVINENGQIFPGDLLVSSSRPGYAMRAGEDPPAGTVIGKALGSLDEEEGMIEAIVMLR